jgi:hypothetical protein
VSAAVPRSRKPLPPKRQKLVAGAGFEPPLQNEVTGNNRLWEVTTQRHPLVEFVLDEVRWGANGSRDRTMKFSFRFIVVAAKLVS